MTGYITYHVRTIVKSGPAAGNKVRLTLCFRHAVEAVTKGADVETVFNLTDDDSGCDVCYGGHAL